MERGGGNSGEMGGMLNSNTFAQCFPGLFFRSTFTLYHNFGSPHIINIFILKETGSTHGRVYYPGRKKGVNEGRTCCGVMFIQTSGIASIPTYVKKKCKSTMQIVGYVS